jgi:hypothetical protein
VKKMMVKNHQDYGAVDNVGTVFDPGMTAGFLPCGRIVG